MAYNNVFPVNYQPYYQQAYQAPSMSNQQINQQQTNSGIIWVQGEAGAKSYLVAPNTTVQLWDSENQVIYLKSADASGMPSMKVIDYTIRQSDNNTHPQGSNSYATKDDIDLIMGEIEGLKSKIESMKHKGNGGKNHAKPTVQLNAE